jgi:hypothetical protein
MACRDLLNGLGMVTVNGIDRLGTGKTTSFDGMLDEREGSLISLRRVQVERPDRRARVIADQEDVIWLVGTGLRIPSRCILTDNKGLIVTSRQA